MIFEHDDLQQATKFPDEFIALVAFARSPKGPGSSMESIRHAFDV